MSDCSGAVTVRMRVACDCVVLCYRVALSPHALLSLACTSPCPQSRTN